MALQLRHFSRTLRILGARSMSQGDWGSGAGKGGGTGGSVRDAGGAFGKMEAAHEEQYFRKLEAIERHKKKIGNLKKEEKKMLRCTSENNLVGTTIKI
ncbi:hypothetical protein KUTeg_000412 [Tegillarca granosa]|uniref:Mitochondrial ATPase inhibitor n=1 Tax=Tegillarca granosa TaxID=220873 RepID=A0ABQ9G0K6_TEGGR|nr:hypothetical protein KUTeg_000412 [Tegillarca granosa]